MAEYRWGARRPSQSGSEHQVLWNSAPVHRSSAGRSSRPGSGLKWICSGPLQMVEPVDLFWKCGLANPHTTHCLGNGQIMISCLGDPAGNGKGQEPPGVHGPPWWTRLTPSPASSSQEGSSCWTVRRSTWLGTGSIRAKRLRSGMTSGTSPGTT